MKTTHLVLMIATLASLCGCALEPGQHVPHGQNGHLTVGENDQIELRQITPQLMAAQQVERLAAAIPSELLGYQPEPYHVGAGDTLYITVWDHPELSSPAGQQQQTLANGRLVRPDGTLFYPYAGLIKAGGMTIEELRDALTHKLSKFVRDPQIDVSVIGYGSQRVTMQGAFVKTDPQPITTTPLTLAQAIGTATINTAQADISNLVLTRDGHDYHLDLDALNDGSKAAPDIYLKPGDHLYLPYNDRHEVYVVGEVVRPMAISFKTTDLSLTQALGRAGGLDPVTSNGKSVYVIRGAAERMKRPATVYQLDAKSPVAFVLGDQFMVKPGDVVFVAPAGVTRWNRVLSQLLPLSGIINTAANAQYDLSYSHN